MLVEIQSRNGILERAVSIEIYRGIGTVGILINFLQRQRLARFDDGCSRTYFTTFCSDNIIFCRPVHILVYGECLVLAVELQKERI